MNPLPRVVHPAAARGHGRRLSQALLLCALVLALAPFSPAAETRLSAINFGDARWPAHPTLLFTKRWGQRYPVVAVEKNAPVVLIDGQRKTLSDSAPLFTQLAEDYFPERVKSGNHIDIGKRTWLQAPQGGTATEAREYTGEITLQSETDIPDCYALITLFDTGAIDDPLGPDFRKTVLVEIGTLRAHETRVVPLSMKVRMALHYSNGDPSKKYTDPGVTSVFSQVFSRGVEIRTGDLGELGVSQYFFVREAVEHADAVEAWVKENRKTDRGAAPYVVTPLQAGMSFGLPKEASAILSVNADGKVTQVVLEQAFPAEAVTNLTNCLKLWLFLPAIKHGSPAPTKIRIPLEF
jgi:hypothetical protein